MIGELDTEKELIANVNGYLHLKDQHLRLFVRRIIFLNEVCLFKAQEGADASQVVPGCIHSYPPPSEQPAGKHFHK